MSNSHDTSRDPNNRPKRRKIDPARVHIQDLAAYLSTDLESGLSPKEAERRYVKRTVKGLFAMEKASFSQSIIPVLKEPVMWLLLVVCVVACVFDRIDVGFGGLVLMLFHGGVCVAMGRSTQKLEKQMQMYDVPLARVIRNHRLLRVPADAIVPGDIILLRAGDILPADARLLSSCDLVVSEETLEGDPNRRETLQLEKNAREMPDDIPRKHSPVHMVYAGSMVVSGEGRALVTATGQRTHMGGLLGKVPVSHVDTVPFSLANFRKKLSVINLITAVVSVPIAALGILTLRGRYDLLELFASTLALSVLSLTEHILIFGSYISASLRRSSASHPDAHLSCEIRDTQTLENLRRMDHLVLLGTAALHDGKPMPDAVLTCDKNYVCGQSAVDVGMTFFAEKMFLYAEAIGYRDDCLVSAVEKMTAWAEPDTETLMLRLSNLKVCGEGVEVTMKRSEPTRLYLLPISSRDADFSAIPWMRCLSQDGNRQAYCEFTEQDIHDWIDWMRAAERQSKRVFVLVSDMGGEMCAEGLISFATETCPKTKGILSSLLDAGIDVAVFLSQDDMWEYTAHLREAGLLKGREVPYALRDESPEQLLHMVQNGTRVFDHALSEDVVAYIQYLRRMGSTVGVLSVDGHDMDILSEADIAMTCCPVDLKDALVKQMPVATEQVFEADGYPDSAMATDICRYTADVVVRRASRQGGGMCGVRQALLTAEQLYKSGYGFCEYMILSQLLRVMMVLLPMLAGLTMLSAPVILFSGFVMDLLAFGCFAKADIPSELTSRRMEKAMAERARKEGRDPADVSKLPVPIAYMILVAISALIPWTAAFVSKLLHVDFGADLGYFGMLCLLATQIALLLVYPRPRRRRLGFFLVVGMICLYVGGIAVALIANLSVMWCLVIPLVQPLCLFVALTLAKKIQARRMA